MKAIGNKKEFWIEQNKKWKASGLSRKDYCRRNDLKVTTFDYYRKKYKGKEEQLVEITNTGVQEDEGIEIRIRKGIGIRVTKEFDRELLRTVIACLEER
jgi:hypothetical protein